MSSVTKNPLILQAANKINAWFTSQIKDNECLKLFNSLEMLESDEHSVEFMTNLKKEEYYEDFENRFKKVIDDEQSK